MQITTRFAASAVGFLAVMIATGCSSHSPSSLSDQRITASCSDLLNAFIRSEQTGSVNSNTAMAALAETSGCRHEYSVAVDYAQGSIDSAVRLGSCEEMLAHNFEPDAVTLLKRDGWCSFGQAAQEASVAWPNGGLGWNVARDNAGTQQRVCGPLMSVRETEWGTFINVGVDYPSSDRFAFVFWDTYLEPIEGPATVCGSGEISLHEGVAQIEMWDPSALELWSEGEQGVRGHRRGILRDPPPSNASHPEPTPARLAQASRYRDRAEAPQPGGKPPLR